MFEKLSDNLNFLMSDVHISADELARRTGVPASTIKKIRNRYSPNPTLTTLLPIAKFFSISLSQLIGDEPIRTNRIKGQYKPDLEKLHSAPIISWTEAIDWPKSNSEDHEFITTEYGHDDNIYALIVEENDWENMALGTALLIDPSVIPEHRDFIIVHLKDQTKPTLKQLLIDDSSKYLKPVISGYSINSLTKDHHILGTVVEYKKQLKKKRLN